ncbi:hypothetical protein V8G61_03510 [Gaetbulibacter sp. M240]|uniref:hypothetical protein n=1 Tax=Gaetbulibacter sp. M240 TaxID=3126511 RepID=UPI00374FBC1A
MDELELLKKDWNKSDDHHKKLSGKEIYPMLHKKSSSTVKMLFYISIAELVLWIGINTIPYLVSTEYREKLNEVYGDGVLMIWLTIISYAIILLFIYLLFKSYKSISVTDNAKKLMESILRTRQIVKYYVLYNLVVAGISLAVGFYQSLHNDPVISEEIKDFSDKQMLVAYAVMIIFSALFILVIWLFYKLIYGLLLKRLNRNYKELGRLEG